jgi:hypothetical protein
MSKISTQKKEDANNKLAAHYGREVSPTISYQ